MSSKPSECRRLMQTLYDLSLPFKKKKTNKKIRPPLVDFYIDSDYLRLHKHVKLCNKQMVRYLLDNGFNVNTQDWRGQTPLMLAIRGNHKNIVEMLLAAEADIDISNQREENALHYAFAHHCSEDILELLFRELQKKSLSSKQIAKKLFDAGCQLYQAAFTENAKIIKYLLQRGLAIKSIDPKTDRTALHIAILLDDYNSVKVLLKYGIDTNALDYQGQTPLYYLCNLLYERFPTSNRLKMLKALCNVPSTSLMTHNFYEIERGLLKGNDEVIRILLKSNLAITAKDEINKRTLLHYIAKNRNPKVIDELNRHIKSYNVNALDRWGESPLNCALEARNINMAEFLLQQGANPNFANNISGITPIYCIYNYLSSNTINERCAEHMLQSNANPQVIFTTETGKKCTIFDAALRTNDFSRMNSAIAHLALLKGLGTPITETIHAKINLCLPFKKYFNRCQKILTKRISSPVTVLKLLTEDEKTLTKYLNNKKLHLKLLRLSYKQDIKISYSYYYNTLKKRIIKVIQQKRLRDKACKSICKIFHNRLNFDNLVVQKLIDYLTDKDLRKLYEL